MQLILRVLEALLNSRTGGDIVAILIGSSVVVATVFGSMWNFGFGFATVDRVEKIEKAVYESQGELTQLKALVKTTGSQLEDLTRQSLEQNIFNQTSAMCRMETGTEARRKMAEAVTSLRNQYRRKVGQEYPDLNCADIR